MNSSTPHARILIIDDDHQLRKIFRALLEASGYVVVDAADYATAVTLMDHTIQLALLDIDLNGKSGLDVLRYIQHHFPLCPTIMVSGMPDRESIIAALNEGAVAFLEKPVTRFMLTHKIEHWLSHYALQKENINLKGFSALYHALQASESKFKAAFESNLVGHLFWNERGEITDANDIFLDMLGFSREELLAGLIHWDKLTPTEYRKQDAHAFQELLSNGTTTPVEKELIRKNGGRIPVLIGSTTLDGPSLNGISLAVDISARKEIELQVISERNKLSAIIENVAECIITITADGIIESFNPAACQTFGYLENEVIGKNVALLMPEPHRSQHNSYLSSYSPENRRFKDGRIEVAARHKSGRPFPLELTISEVMINHQRHFIGIARDISLRKQQENERNIAATAFESQESMIITDGSGVILRTNQAFSKSNGYRAEEILGKSASLLSPDELCSEALSAITNHGGWQGEVQGKRKNGEIYPQWLSISAVKDSHNIITHYVRSYMDITERKAAEKEIEHLAFYDTLTKLPNRRLLYDRLEQALISSDRSNQYGALFFIDLDNFKRLNDTLGHNMGDLLLQQVAKRLQLSVREGDTVARLGGDEFVVLLKKLSTEKQKTAEQSEVIAEKILEALGQPYHLGSIEYISTPSIGITLFKRNDIALDELFKQADIAMYQSKKSGRNAFIFFDPKMQQLVNERASMEDELRLALESNQFQLDFQIQVDSSRNPIGAEALIRWEHPEHGLIHPAQFIPLAEESGLILPIGLWVLNSACAQIKKWEGNPLTRELVLALNVSAKQFHHGDFAADVVAAIKLHDINPMKLKLEMTESILITNIEETITTMKALNDIGIQFSLDDFGTGYSSLQYLKSLPLDQLKIDRSFVHDININKDDKAIVNTIIAMAHSLGINVIAEGVETDAQLQLLLKNHCTHFQGYLFSEPISIDLLEANLIKNQ
ncbi:MAG: EAL domain-containing protein [Mariprofundus sp.]|nr:EAL domain-containing protein [Mariprofundus sp.]